MNPSLSHTPRVRFTARCTYRDDDQLLVKDVNFDSLTTIPRHTTFIPGMDYMTSYNDWLDIQVASFP